MSRGSHFLLTTPTIVPGLRRSRLLSCDAQKKAERKQLANAQTVFRSYRFVPALLGANQRGPVEPILDRFAMGARAEILASGWRWRIVIPTRTRYKSEMWQLRGLRDNYANHHPRL